MDDKSKISWLSGCASKRGGIAAHFPWIRASIFLLVLFSVVVPFTSVPRKLKDYAKEVIAAKRESNQPKSAKLVPSPVEKPAPPVVVPEKEEEEKVDEPLVHDIGTHGDILHLSKGFVFDYSFDKKQGRLASIERKDAKSYVAKYKLHVKLPKPSQTIAELQQVSPDLGSMLPGVGLMLEKGKVSNFYYQLYKNKVARMERDLLKFNQLSTKHNFYDCETILNLQHPTSGRKVLLVQADMDVVSDGSDGDRLPEMPDEIVNSTYYQPFTSYGWKKQTETPNPMVAGWSKRLEVAKVELADPKTDAARKSWLKSRMVMLERGVADMQARSFLIAEYDPFIVMPVNLLTHRTGGHAPRVGDYAVVVFGGKLYPAIVGDGGPNFKAGEASLRLARELNERASPYSRPVSDLTVTYLVFCNSRERSAKAPDLKQWHQRCSELIEEIGGLADGIELHQWKDLLAEKRENETPEPATAVPTE